MESINISTTIIVLSFLLAISILSTNGSGIVRTPGHVERSEILNEIRNYNREAQILIQKTYELYNNTTPGHNMTLPQPEVVLRNITNNNITNKEIQNIVKLMILSLEVQVKKFEIVRDIEQENFCHVLLGNTTECYSTLCYRSGSINIPYCCLETTIKKLGQINTFLIMLFKNINEDANHELKINISRFSLQQQEEFTMTILRRTSLQLHHIHKILKKL